jgi:hypothetical protein
VDAILADAVLRRQRAGEHGDVRWQRQRRGSPRLRELQAPRREAVHGRGEPAANAIRPQRVDADEHEVRPLGRARRVLAPARRGRNGENDDHPQQQR